MKNSRRTDAELAAWHAAQAEKYRLRVTVRSDKSLARIRRAIAMLRKIAGEVNDKGTSSACVELSHLLEEQLAKLAAPKNVPSLPFEEDPDFEVKS